MTITKSFDTRGWYFERIYRYRNRCNISVFNPMIHLLCYIRGVRLGKKVLFNGFPLIRRYENSDIYIGDNCLFNSAKNSVRVGLQRPCVFVTLSEGAEIIIGNHSGATGSTLVAAKKIVIGNNVLIGANSMIIDNDFHNPDPGKRLLSTDVPARPIIIEDNVFIGTNCMILKGVIIGENSVIGANSVVINNIPKNAIAIGNPCKVVIIKNWDQVPK
jgi:acetyltransferase-like isoleucine patch superfamily enzyme